MASETKEKNIAKIIGIAIGVVISAIFGFIGVMSALGGTIIYLNSSISVGIVFFVFLVWMIPPALYWTGYWLVSTLKKSKDKHNASIAIGIALSLIFGGSGLLYVLGIVLIYQDRWDHFSLIIDLTGCVCARYRQ